VLSAHFVPRPVKRGTILGNGRASPRFQGRGAEDAAERSYPDRIGEEQDGAGGRAVLTPSSCARAEPAIRTASTDRRAGLRALRRPNFSRPPQDDLFSEDAAAPEYRPDPDKVRARLHKILAEARAAQKLPWEPTRVTLYRTIFPQMTNWLPEDEGAQLRFEFDAEIARLEAA